MKFQYLEGFHKNWKDILVIGRTIERDDKKYHIVGMTLADEANLYIIEPYSEPEYYNHKTKGAHNIPLKGCVIQTAVFPDTSTIPAELFFYMEKVAGWEEKV